MTELAEVKTIGEVERIVHGSGEWDGTGPVEFSNDGATWSQAWEPTEDHPHPEFARVEVYRKGVRIPSTVTIRWAEQFPEASDEWAAKWVRSPMRHFGRTARMVGFRQTFRDLLGDISIEDEGADIAEQTPDVAEPARDWSAEIEAATSLDELDAIEKAARAERVFTPDATGTALHRQLRAHRNLLSEVSAAPTEAFDASVWDPEPKTTRPAPQDYKPPQNRAARRATARKKGRRR